MELFIVPTPLGNLEDVSPRILHCLAEVGIIACEDTRVTRKLLSLLQVEGHAAKELVSYHNFNEEEQATKIIQRMKECSCSVALVSDAGTPCISDPGYLLVRRAHAEGIKVTSLPGPCAMTTLISGSGLPNHRILFVGFLPQKRSALDEEIQSWSDVNASIVCYESPKRLIKSLEAIQKDYPYCEVALGRELTKMHEEIRLCPISDLIEYLRGKGTIKGECSLVVSLQSVVKKESDDERKDFLKWKEPIRLLAEQGVNKKDIIELFRSKKLSKKLIYNYLLEIDEE